MTETFMPAEQHFLSLEQQLNDVDRAIYDKCAHNRSEVGFAGRNFVVYQMAGRDPETLDRLVVNDFICDNVEGASFEITSLGLQETLTIGYEPQRLFNYPVFMWLPLHCKVRWAAPPSAPTKGSLAFPITLRTQSRRHLRERSVIYCETGPQFGEEFDAPRG